MLHTVMVNGPRHFLHYFSVLHILRNTNENIMTFSGHFKNYLKFHAT
jgi:hypothetical protein